MGNYMLAVGRASRPGRRINRFRFGTCLTGTAALLAIGAVPAAARPTSALVAQSPATPVRHTSTGKAPLPQDLTLRPDRPAKKSTKVVSAPAVPVTDNSIIRTIPAARPIQDPTIRPTAAASRVEGDDVVVQVGTIATTDEGANGVDTVATRSTTITADRISTNGTNAAGVHASGNGPMTIAVGSLETIGDHSDGIYAVTASGSVAIKTNSVSATGALANGIRAASYAGDVNVDVSSVIAGTGTGIDVRGGYNSHGNVAVTAGTVLTNGAGIVALAGDHVEIDVDSVTTTATDHDAYTPYTTGWGVKAVAHGTIDITAGTIVTNGAYADGVYASSWSTGLPGQELGDINIDVGSVTTSGTRSHGVYAVNTGYLEGGNQAVNITTGAVSTSGDYASGIYAVGPNVEIVANGAVSTQGFASTGIYAATLGGNTVITAGDVATRGDLATGVRGFSGGGKVDITTTGAITTAGEGSYGVLAFGSADLTIANSGSVDTLGTLSHGLYAVSNTGFATITNSGAISTSGDGATGIRAVVFVDGAAITSTGKVQTRGDYAAGIIAVRQRIRSEPGAGTGSAIEGSTVSVSADSVSTSGVHSNGILALNYSFGGKTDVKVNSITTTGASAPGIAAVTFGDLAIEAHDIHSSGIGIYAKTRGEYQTAVTVTGTVASTADSAIVVVTTGGEATINVAKGAQVIGGGTRQPIYGGGAGIFLSGDLGSATINNAGVLGTTAANGYAIEALGGVDYYTGIPTWSVTVNNSGTILGGVLLDVGPDTVNNSGVFVATKDSDFGGGGDRFINSGTLRVAPGAQPGQVSFLNLASFENKGGLVDLRNGTAGDVLSLSGNYVGSSDAHLALDIAGAKADMLIVAGAATGKTGIVLDVLGKDARLLANPLTVVKAGIGSAADAFAVANADIGLINYRVSYDAASGSFGLTSRAGAAVYRTVGIQRAQQAVWNRSASGWDAHMAERRDVRWGGGDGFDPKLWGQMYGGVDTQDGHRTIEGNRIETGFRQDYYGAQLGFDLGGKATARVGTTYGITGSYISSNVRGRVSADRTQLDTLSIGAYASYQSGPFFANLLGQYGHDWIKYRDLTLGFADKIQGDSFGAELQVGARFGSERLHIQPLASIAYVRSSADDLHAFDQTIDFDGYDGLRGKIGARIGSTTGFGNSKATFYLQGRYVHEFKGQDGIDFVSGGTHQAISGVRPGDYGEGAIGVNIFSGSRVSGFLEGTADVGSTKGGGGRVGLSFKF